jgi:ferredoxin-type protein NapH
MTPTQLTPKKFLKIRAWRQWLLAPIVIITIVFGWKYYLIPFIVPIVMVINILSLLLKRGRFACGNICPRGAFFDRILRPFSKSKKIPSFFQNSNFRLAIFVTMFGFFAVQATKPPYTIEHFGHLFWIMCTVTTVIGISLGMFFSHRTWCAFCPIGTFLSAAKKDDHPLTIDKNSCLSCKLCERVCPLNIKITKDSEQGFLSNQDCLKCEECVAICPVKALK